MSKTYTDDFYDLIEDGCLASAQAVVPKIIKLIDPASVIDLGCGRGWWLSVFAKAGVAITGVDSPHLNVNRLAIPADRFVPQDLSDQDWLRAKPEETYDLALCLETAAHLLSAYGHAFIDRLCGLAPVILFSAAVPGQGGVGHVNEQWPEYWANRFRTNGYHVSGALRWQIWEDRRVECWYRQNLLLCVAAEVLPPLIETNPGMEELMYGWAARPISVIHPELWDARR